MSRSFPTTCALYLSNAKPVFNESTLPHWCEGFINNDGCEPWIKAMEDLLPLMKEVLDE